MTNIINSLLAVLLVCSIVFAGVCTLGNYIKTHHDDVNTARMNTFIEQGVKP
jgi:hypothetical protein